MVAYHKALNRHFQLKPPVFQFFLVVKAHTEVRICIKCLSFVSRCKQMQFEWKIYIKGFLQSATSGSWGAYPFSYLWLYSQSSAHSWPNRVTTTNRNPETWRREGEVQRKGGKRKMQQDIMQTFKERKKKAHRIGSVLEASPRSPYNCIICISMCRNPWMLTGERGGTLTRSVAECMYIYVYIWTRKEHCRTHMHTHVHSLSENKSHKWWETSPQTAHKRRKGGDKK